MNHVALPELLQLLHVSYIYYMLYSRTSVIQQGKFLYNRVKVQLIIKKRVPLNVQITGDRPVYLLHMRKTTMCPTHLHCWPLYRGGLYSGVAVKRGSTVGGSRRSLSIHLSDLALAEEVRQGQFLWEIKHSCCVLDLCTMHN